MLPRAQETHSGHWFVLWFVPQAQNDLPAPIPTSSSEILKFQPDFIENDWKRTKMLPRAQETHSGHWFVLWFVPQAQNDLPAPLPTSSNKILKFQSILSGIFAGCMYQYSDMFKVIFTPQGHWQLKVMILQVILQNIWQSDWKLPHLSRDQTPCQFTWNGSIGAPGVQSLGQTPEPTKITKKY